MGANTQIQVFSTPSLARLVQINNGARAASTTTLTQSVVVPCSALPGSSQVTRVHKRRGLSVPMQVLVVLQVHHRCYYQQAACRAASAVQQRHFFTLLLPVTKTPSECCSQQDIRNACDLLPVNHLQPTHSVTLTHTPASDCSILPCLCTAL